jgi:PAS domain-containing protein
VKPRNGDVVALDLRAAREDDRIVGYFRFAGDIEVSPGAGHVPAALVSRPSSDPVFRQFAERLLATMHEPTADRFELALRRLYPHARVTRRTEDDTWEAFRDADAESAGTLDVAATGGETPTPGAEWWRVPSLPRLRYDSRGLILDANDAAVTFLGRQLVGRHWQELVTPTATDVVSPVLDIIRHAGVAVSRFRMPTGDGTLVEFDSYTTAEGETLTTVMKPT